MRLGMPHTNPMPCYAMFNDRKYVDKTTYKPNAMLCYAMFKVDPKGVPIPKSKKTCVLRFPGGVRPKMLENT